MEAKTGESDPSSVLPNGANGEAEKEEAGTEREVVTSTAELPGTRKAGRGKDTAQPPPSSAASTGTDRETKIMPFGGEKIESRLNVLELQAMQEAFMIEGSGYDNKLSLNKEEFIQKMTDILKRQSNEEYSELFDKIDVTKDGYVDWDKIASHMLLEYYEKDDRVKATQVPQWKDLKILQSPHKDTIQKIKYHKATQRYISISKEGCVALWSPQCKLQKSVTISVDSVKDKDLWVSDYVLLPNINKIALSLTSKEILFYDLSTKLDFSCQYKVEGLEYTPLALDYWSNPDNPSEAFLVFGDVGGQVTALNFTSTHIALFERPTPPVGEEEAEVTVTVQLSNIAKGRDKYCKMARHREHNGEWTRQVRYAAHLECFISCSTTARSSMVLGWVEKAARSMRTISFNVSQGIHCFDYHEQMNLIVTGGVNHHVSLWNPYVTSKPIGLLRGHMASVVNVQFNTTKGQILSFSKDKVLRVWDIQQQLCLQRVAGIFPKGPEVYTFLQFDEERLKMFITFNNQLTLLEMKPEMKDKILSHDKPITSVLYNRTYNQVISGCQGSTVTVWIIDSGQKVKQFENCHGSAEITTMALDPSDTRLYTASTDGTVKIWDFNGHCHHLLNAGRDSAVDITQVLVLKRTVLVMGWDRMITVFRFQAFTTYTVQPSDWKGGQEHQDDILCGAFSDPNTLATGSYDGEIIMWNNQGERASRHLRQRVRQKGKTSTRQTTTAGSMPTVTRQGTVSSFTGTDDKALLSREVTGLSLEDEENSEFGNPITRMLFLEERKDNLEGGGNLVSCGGNGFVRFWSTGDSSLVAEFLAHPHIGSIIMATDDLNRYLATGDVDGNAKVWNIEEYCLRHNPDGPVCTDPPPLLCNQTPHLDSINQMLFCRRNDCDLIVSCSSDCSVALWDVHGNIIGYFGQEEKWKIEEYIPPEEPEEDDEKEADEDEELHQALEAEEEMMELTFEEEGYEEDYRHNTWEKTYLGKAYQDLRVQKRERKQPTSIPNLPYLTWEKTGQAPAGPYKSLETSDLMKMNVLKKPDFVVHPHKYFGQRTETPVETVPKLPSLTDGLKAAFDEKTLFPKYIMEFELKMKSVHGIMSASKKGRVSKSLLATSKPNLLLQSKQSMNSISSKQSADNLSPKSRVKAGLQKVQGIPDVGKKGQLKPLGKTTTSEASSSSVHT
ncbi:cilia- and flagella-associated protein 337-like [Branchiostoma floridae x Branchiostoma japonicum]